jgi:deoxyribodipyrimidine photo-lyase
MEFTTNYAEIIELVEQIDPIKYSKTRNYLNGAVTKLSPYISRGVISTKFVYDRIMAKGYKLYEIEKFVQELGWRDFFQLVWKNKGDLINTDLKNEQLNVLNNGIANTIITAQTGITAIDEGITKLYQTGYMHNHLRMYTASIACNVAGSHWSTPARWMYYHLYDADWASNALSWQWVAGSFSNKKYFANQENINKFCNTNQQNTFLDLRYDVINEIQQPSILKNYQSFNITTNLPNANVITLNNELPLLVYNFYNLDPNWLNNIKANRVLLLEPSFFNTYPSNDHVIEFVLSLSKNIADIKIFVGEFNELKNNYNGDSIFYKEHPTALHYVGKQYSRDWLVSDLTGYFPSFFAYWKKAESTLKKNK